MGTTNIRDVHRSQLLPCMSLLLAQGCRRSVMQQVGSYSGHSGCGANAIGKAALTRTGLPMGKPIAAV